MTARVERVSISRDVYDLRKRTHRGATGQIVQATVKEAHDGFTVGTSPASTYTLTSIPVAVLVVSVNGEKLVHGDEWTCDNTTGVLTLGSSVVSRLKATPAPADVVTVDYLTSTALAASTVLVPWMSDGWLYNIVAHTDTTDYSPVAYVDSAWTSGQAPFGGDTTTGTVKDWMGGYNVAWPTTGSGTTTYLWVRRHLGALPTSGTVTIQLRVDNFAKVFWNGTMLRDGTTDDYLSADESGTEVSIVVPTADIGGDNILAVRADSSAGGASDAAVLDVKVVLS